MTKLTKKQIKEKAQDDLLAQLPSVLYKLREDKEIYSQEDYNELKKEMHKQAQRICKLFGITEWNLDK